MTEKTGSVFEWKIENFSHWCAEVHSDCIKNEFIQSPEFYIYRSSFTMQLFPKGIRGQGEHLVVRLCGADLIPFPCELYFYASDGSCSKEQQSVGINRTFQPISGPKFEDVLSRIRKTGDFITLKLRVKDMVRVTRYTDVRYGNKYNLDPYDSYGVILKSECTTLNVLKISLEINPKWIEEMKSVETKDLFYIQLYPNDNRMWLKICSANNKVHFTITTETRYGYPFGIEMCVTLKRRNGTVDSCVKKEHVFYDDSSWTFPDPLEKKESVKRRIFLDFCLKNKNPIQSPLHVSCASCISIESKNKICFPEKAPTTYPVTSNKVAGLTKDSGSQTSLASDFPDDSVLVLSKELMCLYQDQKYSDITLKCNNVSFPVHKNILSARSPVFDRLLTSDMKEAASSEVDIGDLDPSTLSRFLTYLYTGAVEEELQCDRALKLYYAADKYQVSSLKKECSKFLCDNVSVSNVCDILSLADRHNDDHLITVSHDFILDNYNAVLKSKEWGILKKNEPVLVAETVTLFAVEDRVRKHHPL